MGVGQLLDLWMGGFEVRVEFKISNRVDGSFFSIFVIDSLDRILLLLFLLHQRSKLLVSVLNNHLSPANSCANGMDVEGEVE